MKHLFILFSIIISFNVVGQNNYVATSPSSSTPGTNNTFIGSGAGATGGAMQANVFVGAFSGSNNSFGSENVFVGSYSGFSNSFGVGNVFVGSQTGYKNNSGTSNVFLGNRAGFENIYGDNNLFFGNDAGHDNTAGSANIFTGVNAGRSNTTGGENIFIGLNAGRINTVGQQNTFIGTNSAFTSTTASANTFVGYQTGYYTIGSSNTFFGHQAGYNNTTGSNNIIIGPNSGTAITTSDDNVLMGYNSQADDGLQNAIAIGSNSRVAVSNAMILGNGVNVGIGTSAPTNRLHVRADQAGQSGIRLEQLTSDSPVANASDQFLTVDGQGNVVKARYRLRIQDPAQWSDKVFTPGYSLKPLPTVEAYIQQNRHLPDVPSAEEIADKGVDLVKMNALLLQKIEELTLHSIEQEKRIKALEEKLSEKR
ncbi:hypothetical protein [Spirosoma panaciterrae]|uniref:hypothetical protein n=1 Tax=Spirosoma panaciterrae TaxID=496058 RepID=UPI000379E64D|nr:hypothetical protein [Spirosoma panaciterrae]